MTQAAGLVCHGFVLKCVFEHFVLGGWGGSQLARGEDPEDPEDPKGPEDPQGPQDPSCNGIPFPFSFLPFPQPIFPQPMDPSSLSSFHKFTVHSLATVHSLHMPIGNITFAKATGGTCLFPM